MLVLTEPSAQYRERFLAGELSPNSDPLSERWGRARERGAYAEGPAHSEGVTRSELQLRRERLESLLHGEHALLAPIVRELAARELLAIIADRDGVVLHRHGGDGFTDTATKVRLIEGACWSEDVRGTNAIGTALLERRPVGVLGGAHFEQTNAGLFCYCAPVRDALGEVVCALDVSGPLAVHDATLGVTVRAASAALELALRKQAYSNVVEGGLPALQRLVDHMRQPAFVIDVRGEVLLANRAAHPMLSAFGHTQLAPYLSSLAGGTARFDSSLACGTARLDPRRLARWRGALGEGFVREGEHTLNLEPLTDHQGRLLALLVGTRAPSRPITRVEAAPFRDILASDPAVLREKARAESFARSELPVLLLAETGTGKELFARAIHATSPRAAGPFLPLNCAALSDTLLESELFGHAPHAFTGASRHGVTGKLEAAHGGSLFLDEIADMPLALQSALLRFLDDGSFCRVGESKPRHASVRLICATCRDLPALVREGRFRQDLFYRVQGACVRPPPLRERSDRVWLAERLLPERTVALTRSAVAHIESHSWPGNVRELKTALAHALALADGHLLERAHFPDPLLGVERTVVPARLRSRDELLREAVDEALRITQGNVSEAARRLHMARSTLYRILQKPG